MKSLIWKQWRESRFHFYVFCVWMLLAALYAIAYELGHHYRAVVGSFSTSAMLFSTVAAIVLAARAAQGERTDRTLTFTTSIPVSIRLVATVRIVGAILTLAIPIAIGAFIVATSLALGWLEQATPRPIPAEYAQMPQRTVAAANIALEQLASVSCIAMLGGVELLVVLSLYGLYLRSQAQVGGLGAVLALVVLVIAEPMWSGSTRWPLGQLLYGIVLPQSLVVHWGYGNSTGGYVDHELALYRWWSVMLALPLLAWIAWGYVVRYGKVGSVDRVGKPSRVRFAMPALLSRVAIPLPTRWSALLWLELRQSLPLACYGLLLAILVTVVGKLGQTGTGFVEAVRGELPHSVFFVGMLWAIVVGSSLYSTDLGEKVGGFRRSRPIPHAIWFWNKFFIGLAAMLLVMDGTTILVSWNAPRTYSLSEMSYAYIACMPLLHALFYSLAVMGTCLFRRPLIGGVLAVLSYSAVSIALTTFPGTMQLDPLSVYNDLLITERNGVIDFTQHGYPLVYGVLLAMAAIFSLVSLRVARPAI
ncbi:MAG: hypothetical protein IT423_19295 [Pirellulaceae bacterium]|nr:hypothetical protein [Pirellulaceae bacterium]